MSDITLSSRASGSYGTATARALERKQTAASQAQAREVRVAELRKQYQAGQYKTDSVELSAAIIAEHLKGQF